MTAMTKKMMIARNAGTLACGCAVWTLLCAAAPAAIPFFGDGRTEWTIVMPDRAGPVEKYAARELQESLLKIAGVTFPVVPESERPQKKGIVMGSPESSPSIKALVERLNLNVATNVEHVVVRTLDGNLYLAGNMPRAGLFAVYRFLQGQLGARWLWPGDSGTFLPARTSWELPELDLGEMAGIRLRELTMCWRHHDGPTEVWLGRNLLSSGSRTAAIREEMGFVNVMFDHWVSTRGLSFDDHPESFGMINGQRDPKRGGAGCWSSPAFLAHNVRRIIDIAKGSGMEVCIAYPADTTLRCGCPDCTRDPDVSARWWNFYAKLIDEVHRELPDLKFGGLGYQEYRGVPGVPIRGLEFVEYGQYNRCYVHKLDAPACGLNRTSMAEMKRWQGKAPMGIYGYHFDAFDPWMYVPFWNMLADEMRTYRDMGLVRVKSEMWLDPSGKRKREESRMACLRLPYYLYAQLAWNPDARTEDLLADWCATVYGPAAAEMLTYHTVMAQAWDGMQAHVSYYFNKPIGVAGKFLDQKRIVANEALFKTALERIGALPDSPEKQRCRDEVDLERAFFRKWTERFRMSKSFTQRAVSLPKADSFADAVSLRMASPSTNHLPTEAAMYWDDTALHLRVVCHEPNMAGLRKGTVGRDLNLWQGDHIELFLDLDDGSGYRHLALNPAGGTYDAIGMNPDWNPDWQSGIELGTNQWSAQLSLPFAELGALPVAGSKWLMVLNRNSRPAACGFPMPAYHDMNLGALVYFYQP